MNNRYAELASTIFSKYFNENDLKRREQLIYFFHRASRKADAFWLNDWDLLRVAQCDRLESWTVKLMGDEEFNALIKRCRSGLEVENLTMLRDITKRKRSHFIVSCLMQS